MTVGYDYLSRRIQKTTYTYTGSEWTLDTDTTFVYDGWNAIQETTTPAGGSAQTVQYVWGLDLSGTQQGAGGIGGLLLRKTDSGTFQYLYDANGNVGQLVNGADGSLAARYEYDPFGNTIVADGPEADSNPYRYSTKYFISEIGWYDYGYRYYDPELGRWPTRDPIEETGGLNLYNFVGNNPITLVDPDGRKLLYVPRVTIRNCAEYTSKIEEDIREIVKRIQTCLPCEDEVAALDAMTEVIIECKVTLKELEPGWNVCGYVDDEHPNIIFLGYNGLNEVPGCGCLKSGILHEVLHLIGYEDIGSKSTYITSRKCFLSCTPMGEVKFPSLPSPPPGLED